MSAWERTLEDLEREAVLKTLENPLADLPMDVAKRLREEIKDLPADQGYAKMRIAAQHLKVQKPAPERIVRGWHIIMSRVRDPDTGTYHRHVSAVLWPKGRPHVLTDWDNLGRMIAFLGAPLRPIVEPPSPNDVHHWHWIES